MPATTKTSPAVRDPRARAHGRVLLATVAFVSVGAWATSAVAVSSRGLDLTDESSYLLSYRWWDSNARNFSGAQYLYGPLFEALGYSVPALRVARLVLLVAGHAVFVLAVRDHLRRTARPAWSWSLPMTVLLFATAGISYGWLPQSPGYNDIALLGALVLGAAAVRVATAVVLGSRPPVLLLAFSGAFLVVVGLAKWSAAMASGVLVWMVLVGLLRHSALDLVRAVIAAAGGAALFIMLFSVLVGPWDEVLAPMREVNALVSDDTNSPLALLVLYLVSTAEVLGAAALCAVVGLLPSIVRNLSSAGVPGGGAGAWAAAAPIAATVPWAAVWESPQGGAGSARTYTVSLLAALLACVAAAVIQRREVQPTVASSAPAVHGSRLDRIFVLGLLVALPAAQAFGTGNALYLLAVHGLVFWAAAALVIIADGAQGRARVLATSGLGTCAALVALIATSSLLLHPYRSAPVTQPVAHVPGSEALEGLSLDEETAARLTKLLEALDDTPRTLHVYAVDELAGLVLVADRPPAGEPWTSRLDRDRAAAGLRAYCSATEGSVPPLVFADRPLLAVEREILQRCGLSNYSSYRTISPTGGPDGVRVHVPDIEEATR